MPAMSSVGDAPTTAKMSVTARICPESRRDERQPRTLLRP